MDESDFVGESFDVGDLADELLLEPCFVEDELLDADGFALDDFCGGDDAVVTGSQASPASQSFQLSLFSWFVGFAGELEKEVRKHIRN